MSDPVHPPLHPHTAEPPGEPSRWAYGLMGLPLAFVALPLYVHAPHHYAQTLGVPLASLGVALLFARTLDAVTDPWIGRWTDRSFVRGPHHALRQMWWGIAAILIGAMGLWFPPLAVLDWGALWLTACIILTSLGYSQLTIAHQAWGGRISHTPVQRSRTMAWREAWALLGVVCASVMPSLLDWRSWIITLAALLLVGMWAWHRSAPDPEWPACPATDAGPAPPTAVDRQPAHQHHSQPWRETSFRRLMSVFVINGMASALPATLVMFFIEEVLQLAAWSGGFLAIYFVSAAVGMPLWVRAVKRWGLERSWALGMLIAVLSFASAATLGAGDGDAYALICIGSGLALGADLAIPSALLAGLAHRRAAGEHSGIYFGWWNLATKLNLALAAGLGLPLLSMWGYVPQSETGQGLQALVWVYAVAPCVLKLTALALLRWWLWPTGVTSTK